MAMQAFSPHRLYTK